MAFTADQQVYFDQIEPQVISAVLVAESVDQATYDTWTDAQKLTAVAKQWALVLNKPHTPSATTVQLADPVN